MTPPSIWQIVLILVIVLLLFGAKKIPELAKGLGSGIKNFKKAIREEDEESPNNQGETSQIKQTQASESSPSNTKADSQKQDA